MPNFTKKAIKETFLSLLDERPLNKITVKDVVESCGINRNSFYYHYQDLPALLEEIIAERLQALMSDHPAIDSIEDSFDAALDFVLDHKRAVLHIYNSLSRDVFEHYLMEVCRYVVATYVESAFAGRETESREMLIRYHKCACFGHIIDWLNTGMKDDVSSYFHQFCALRLSWQSDEARI